MFKHEESDFFSKTKAVKNAYWRGVSVGFVLGAAIMLFVNANAHPPCAQAPDRECTTITDIDLETGEVTYIYRCPGG